MESRSPFSVSDLGNTIPKTAASLETNSPQGRSTLKYERPHKKRAQKQQGSMH